LSVFIPSHEFVVQETEHWRVNHRVDTTLPGYLIVGAKDSRAVDLNHLPQAALVEMGPLFSSLTDALQSLFEPEHVHICRFGHDSGQTLHFHIIPSYDWVKEAYRVAATEGGTEIQYPAFSDGASLTLFVSEEFARGRAPCEIIGPNIEEVIRVLKIELSTRNL
jgi:diadenosine tetraphosphate (Ap4A) HIT family hydrolase